MYCPHCNSDLDVKYSGYYDAHYCEACDIWLESQCSDPNCEFCQDRPDKPSQVNLD